MECGLKARKVEKVRTHTPIRVINTVVLGRMGSVTGTGHAYTRQTKLSSLETGRMDRLWGKWIHEDGTSYHGSFDTLGRPVGKGLYYHRNGLVQHGEYVVEGKEDEDDDNEESQDPIYVGGEIFESSVNPVDVTHAVHSFLEDVPLKRAEKLSKCIIFEGGPGCRKDAIAAGTAEQLGWISVSAADLVPSGEGESKDADENAVLELLRKKVRSTAARVSGCILSNFPSTASQAKALSDMCDVTIVIVSVSEEEARARLREDQSEAKNDEDDDPEAEKEDDGEGKEAGEDPMATYAARDFRVEEHFETSFEIDGNGSIEDAVNAVCARINPPESEQEDEA